MSIRKACSRLHFRVEDKFDRKEGGMMPPSDSG